VKAVLALGIGLALVALFGVWKTTALAVAAVILILFVPRWERVTFRGRRVGKYVTPPPTGRRLNSSDWGSARMPPTA